MKLRIFRLFMQMQILVFFMMRFLYAQSVTVEIPDTSGITGTPISIPVNVLTDVTTLGIYSYQFTLCFDGDILQFVDLDLAGTMSATWSNLSNPISSDQIRVLAYTTDTPLAGKGVLFYLTFNVIGGNNDQSALNFCAPDMFFFNAGTPSVTVINGVLTCRNYYEIHVDTQPSGLDVKVDSETVTTPQTFEWSPQSSHTLNALSPQIDTGVQYLWNSWNDEGEQEHSITVSSDFTFVAQYDTLYQLEIAVNPQEGGEVTTIPSGIWFSPNTVVELNSAPNPGYYFMQWSGDLSGDYDPAYLIMDNPKQVTAQFGNLVNIQVITIPAGLQIRIDNHDWRAAPWSGQWLVGSSHTIETNPVQNGSTGVRYQWLDWNDGGNYSHSVIVPDSNTTYQANFETQYSLNISINPENGGNVIKTPSATWYDAQSSVGIAAIPDPNFRFLSWSGNNSGSANPDTIIMTGPKNITANFEANAAVPFNFPGEGWYMISLPVTPPARQVTSLFPTALGGMAYEWLSSQAQYHIVTELDNGTGYWIAIPGSTSVTISGATFNSYTKTYNQGWYLLGSVLGGAGFSNPNDNPDGAVLTPAYGWTVPAGPYLPVTAFNESGGYWVAVNQTCQLTIANESLNLISQRILTNGPEISDRRGLVSPQATVVKMNNTPVAEGLKITQNIISSFNVDILIIPDQDTSKSFMRTFGGDETASDAFDSHDLMGPPPGLSYYVYFFIEAFPNYLWNDIRHWQAPYQESKTWTLMIMNGLNTTSTLSWQPDSLPSIAGGKFTFIGAEPDSIDMKSVSTATVIGNAVVQIEYTFKTPSGWSLDTHANPDTAGVVIKNPDEPFYRDGQLVQLIAKPYKGFQFQNWIGDVEVADNDTTIILMNNNKMVIAVFQPDQSTVTSSSFDLPREFHLSHNYPNPFNPLTRIDFALPRYSHTLVEIINLRGEVIKTLIDADKSVGQYSLTWDGTAEDGTPVASGVYLIYFRAGNFRDILKISLIR